MNVTDVILSVMGRLQNAASYGHVLAVADYIPCSQQPEQSAMFTVHRKATLYVLLLYAVENVRELRSR